jgi:hypothetical protein
MNELLIDDETRLQERFSVSSFRKPYPFIDDRFVPNAKLTIPAVRFPQWHYCGRCGRMREVPLQQRDKPGCAGNECRGHLLPVRFVAVCPMGHIQDVPFIEWVHRGPKPDNGKDHSFLTYQAGSGSGDLSGIWIKCSCGQQRNLAGLMGLQALTNLDGTSSRNNQNENDGAGGYRCKGYRPWLGPEGISHPQTCTQELRVLIRGGTNIHYPIITSALYLPGHDGVNPFSEKIISRLSSSLAGLASQDSGGFTLKAILTYQPEVISGDITIDELLTDVRNHLSPTRPARSGSDEEMRFEEYNYILKEKKVPDRHYKAQIKEFNEYDDADLLKQYFDRIVLIERLRETKVFAGFTRIHAQDGRDVQQRINDLSLKPVSWLPGHMVYGEGIFLQFNTGRLADWMQSKQVQDYARQIIRRYHEARRNRLPDYQERPLDPAFIMIHTFAHLLINRLCFNCGYGSSSLKERIYYSSNPDMQMNGVLIYTSSGDSEGSMGGLVRQGREGNLSKLIRESLEDAQWCSSDPVCSDVGGTSGQGPDQINGAACHNCAIVPETSCEEFNMLLDRALVIDTAQQKGINYFSL